MNEPQMIDSGISVSRDLTKVDCYVIQPYGAADGRGVSVSATLLATVAEAVARQGDLNVIHALEALRDAPADWVA